MRDIEIPLPADADDLLVERILDEVVASRNLQVTLRGTLKKFPGCIHWHVKQGCEKGTLEITLWPQECRAWFTVQSGREASWVDAEIKGFSELFRQRLTEACDP